MEKKEEIKYLENNTKVSVIKNMFNSKELVKRINSLNYQAIKTSPVKSIEKL